jgi:hypothetical protein
VESHSKARSAGLMRRRDARPRTPTSAMLGANAPIDIDAEMAIGIG